jgi:hypothetical protein
VQARLAKRSRSLTSTPSRTTCHGWLSSAFSSLGHADEIGDRRISLAHLGEYLLGRNTAIHYPDALCLAVLSLDLVQGVT